MKYNKLYILAIGLVFATLAIVFDTFPRSTFSTLEKRDLDSLPALTWKDLKSGDYTERVSHWFSDTEPYRDVFMGLSMQAKKLLALSTGEDNITFHASSDEMDEVPGADELGTPEVEGKDYVNHNAKEKAKIANNGIVVVGKGEKVRALMCFGGAASGGVTYAQACNMYKKEFPQCRVYCMVIPTAIEYYCPDEVRERSRSQLAVIHNINAHLEDVDSVDVYMMLQRHADEDIYLRTDHHWSPLGGYYAAKAFAKVAGVPFLPLTEYKTRMVRNYVGSMYSYSKDISVKNAPEDFVYYVPKDSTYTTTYVDYQINRNYEVVGESKPRKGSYFVHYRDGSSGAYCTFMGGDIHITHVHTQVGNGRRLLIFKDSFGNAVPSNLFSSFEDIHIVDTRYFTRNMRRYVSENEITDILFANNVFTAYNPNFLTRYKELLNQGDNTIAAQPKVEKEKKAAEEVRTTVPAPAKHKRKARRRRRR